MELINLLKTNNIKKEMEIIKKNRFKEDYEGIIILTSAMNQINTFFLEISISLINFIPSIIYLFLCLV